MRNWRGTPLEICDQIDQLQGLHEQLRHIFQYADSNNSRPPLQPRFSDKENNRVAHYLNENYIVRIYTVIDYFTAKETTSLFKFKDYSELEMYDGAHDMKLLIDLRNHFAHGFTEGNTPAHQELADRIVKLYKVDYDRTNLINLNKNLVLKEKLIPGCKKYIMEFYERFTK